MSMSGNLIKSKLFVLFGTASAKYLIEASTYDESFSLLSCSHRKTLFIKLKAFLHSALVYLGRVARDEIGDDDMATNRTIEA